MKAYPSYQKNKNAEKVLLIGVRLPGYARKEAEESLEELEQLAITAGAAVQGALSQEIHRIDPAYFVGSGKVEEIAAKAKELKCVTVLFDEDLSPSQNRNLEEAIKIKVVDRTGLILDIFAQRAKSREGKLQVELAQDLYLQSRLVGQWGHLSRQTGGIGTRGPGETQLEVDRRLVKDKITRIKRELQRVASAREIHRSRRSEVPIPTVSLVGYTNSGKSTLMNALTQAGVLMEDKLFATLDPTVRRLKLPSGREVLLSDTVGFIRKLPHALVESFKATFEEIQGADLLIHLMDISHPSRQLQKTKVLEVLKDLKLDQKAILEVYNKIDLMGYGLELNKNDIGVSALRQEGLDKLLHKLDQLLSKGFKSLTLKIPHQEGGLLSFLHRYGRILKKEYQDDGVFMEVEVFQKFVKGLAKFKVKKQKGDPKISLCA
ncbi:MAG: GTPase HflX [Deltaproteobacteria bacterium]|nr:GTPase HflX [Deltaproteobacteria bacterium]